MIQFDRPRFCVLCDLASCIHYGHMDLPDGRGRNCKPAGALRQIEDALRADPAWAEDGYILEEARWLKHLMCDAKSDPAELPETLWERGELLLSLLRELGPKRAARLPVDPSGILKDHELLLEAIRCVFSAMNGQFGNEYTMEPLLRTLLQAMPQDGTLRQEMAFRQALADALPDYVNALVMNPLKAETWPDPMFKAFPMGDPRRRVHLVELGEDPSKPIGDPVWKAARENEFQAGGRMPGIGTLATMEFSFNLHPELLMEYPQARTDWTLMCYLVSMNGGLLALAAPELRDSKPLVRVAVENDPNALRYASPRLRRDPELMKLASAPEPTIAWFRSLEDYWYHRETAGPTTAYSMKWDQASAVPEVGQTRRLNLMDHAFAVRRGDAFYALHGLSGGTSPDGVQLTRCRLLEGRANQEIEGQFQRLIATVRVEQVWTPEAWAADTSLSRRMPWPYWQSIQWVTQICATYVDDRWPRGRVSVEGTFEVYDGTEKWYVYTDDARSDHVLMTEKISGDMACFSMRYVGNLELGGHMERVRRNLIAETETLDGRFRYGFQMGPFGGSIVHVTRYLLDDVEALSIPAVWRLWMMYAHLKEQGVVIHERAFQGCTAFQRVTLPENTRYIESFAFVDCPNLNWVSIPRGTRVGCDAFHGCAGDLTLAVFPDSPAHAYARDNGIACELL